MSQRKFFLPFVFLLHTAAWAGEQNWVLTPYAGLSDLSNTSATGYNFMTPTSSAAVKPDVGYLVGADISYFFTNQFSAELGWEYRSNKSTVILNNADQLQGGNYASNTIYLNGRYHWIKSGHWQPYVGVGLAWLQEIDIDIMMGGKELSLSESGDIGYQLLLGADYQLKEKWKLQTELRYADFGRINLNGEEGSIAQLKGIGYKPLTVQLGLSYTF